MDKKISSNNRIFEKLSAVYLLLMLSAFLLYPGTGGYAEMTKEKWKAYLLLTGLFLAVSILLRAELALVAGYKLQTPRRFWQRLNLVQKLIIVYWGLSLLSAVVSVDRRTAFFGNARCEGLIAITLYCGSFLMISLYGKPDKLLLAVFGAAMTANCILCLIQLAGHNPFSLYPQGMNYYDANKLYSGEFLGTVGNVDLLSAVLTLSIPVFAVSIWKLRGRWRYLLLIPLLLCIYVLVRSRVAGGFIGLAGCLLISVPVLIHDRKKKRFFIAVSLIIVILGIAAVYFFGGRFSGTLYEFSEVLHGRINDNFGSKRVFIWRNVLTLIPERPLLGGGPDTLGLRMQVGFERYDEELGMLITSTIDAAHNEYLNILANQGVLALIVYLSALIVSAICWFRSADSVAEAAICGSAVLGYCIQAFFGLSSPISAPFFWIAFSLLNNTQTTRKGEPYVKVK